MESFHLRPFAPQDGPAFDRLQLESPDTGRIHFTYHYQIDPYAALHARQGDFLGVVAEVPGHDGLVGACLVDFREAQIEGALRPCGLLNTLVVHPEFRRRGIATALVTWCVQAARERFGDEGVVWALIQRGNVGSVRTLTKHLRQTIPERIVSIPIKVRSRPPRPMPGWHVREADEDDLPRVAERMNRFYDGYNFYRPQTADTLAQWLTTSPFETPFRRYLVLTDGAGEILAGAGVEEGYRLGTLHVEDMSPSLRVLNGLLRLVPADGVSKGLTLTKVWHAPGQVWAARYLVESICWQWRDQATMAAAHVDLESPLIRVFPLRPWTPAPRLSVVAAGPVALSPERYIAY